MAAPEKKPLEAQVDTVPNQNNKQRLITSAGVYNAIHQLMKSETMKTEPTQKELTEAFKKLWNVLGGKYSTAVAAALLCFSSYGTDVSRTNRWDEIKPSMTMGDIFDSSTRWETNAIATKSYVDSHPSGLDTNAVQGIVQKNIETNNLCTVAAAIGMTNNLEKSMLWRDLGFFIEGGHLPIAGWTNSEGQMNCCMSLGWEGNVGVHTIIENLKDANGHSYLTDYETYTKSEADVKFQTIENMSQYPLRIEMAVPFYNSKLETQNADNFVVEKRIAKKKIDSQLGYEYYATTSEVVSVAEKVFSDNADYELVAFESYELSLKSGQIGSYETETNVILTLNFINEERSGDCMLYLVNKDAEHDFGLEIGPNKYNFVKTDSSTRTIEAGSTNIFLFTKIKKDTVLINKQEIK